MYAPQESSDGRLRAVRSSDSLVDHTTDIELTVAVGQQVGMGVGFLASTRVSITLTQETEKPIPELEDDFWQEFCSQASLTLHSQFFLSTTDQQLMRGIVAFLVPFAGTSAIGGKSYTATVLIFLTVPWIMHCRLCYFTLWPLYIGGMTVPGVYLSMYFSLYALGAMLMILAFTAWRCMAKDSEETHTLSELLLVLNVHCQDKLQGFRIRWAFKNLDREVSELILAFERNRRATIQQEVDQRVRVAEEDKTQETRVLIKSISAWRTSQQEEDGEDNDCNFYSGQDNTIGPTNTIMKPPSGTSTIAWRTFLQDVKADIYTTQNDVSRMQNITLALIIHALISVGFYKIYGAINWLLPLHMTPPLFFNRYLRRRLKRKFDIIEAFGGQSSLLGSQYEVSYHPVLWYSRSQDYILIKHRNHSNQESAAKDTALGENSRKNK